MQNIWEEKWAIRLSSSFGLKSTRSIFLSEINTFLDNKCFTESTEKFWDLNEQQNILRGTKFFFKYYLWKKCCFIFLLMFLAQLNYFQASCQNWNWCSSCYFWRHACFHFVVVFFAVLHWPLLLIAVKLWAFPLKSGVFSLKKHCDYLWIPMFFMYNNCFILYLQ